VAFPLVRQYPKYVLLGVIRGLQIPVPLDFSIRDDRKMVQNRLDSIAAMVDAYDAAGSLDLTNQLMSRVSVPSSALLR
jgi:hypothetical protein